MTATLIDFAGFVALLLWGTHMVQTGVQRAAGARLKLWLGHALRGRLSAFAAGIGVTALLQSSTATGLMVTGFAATGLLALVPALAVMLGANVGTTLIVQLLAFDVQLAAPLLVLIGVVVFRRLERGRLHDLGRVAIGLGLMLLALDHLSGNLAPLADSQAVRTLIGLLQAAPVAAVMLAAALTWMAHSSVAVVLLVMSMAGQGLVAGPMAIALVLGANLGTAINPVLEGAGGDDPQARRLPLGNLINRVIGVVAALILIEPVAGAMGRLVDDPVRMVAVFHTLFNLTVAAVFLPVLRHYAGLLARLLPVRAVPADPARTLYLDEEARETPEVALGLATREVLRMADVLDDMLAGARAALRSGEPGPIAALKGLDDVLDHVNRALKTYLAGIEPARLSPADERRLTDLLTFATRLEQAGDAVDRGLLPTLGKCHKRGVRLSKEGQGELLRLLDRLRDNLAQAAALLMTRDLRAARLLAAEKAVFRRLETEATLAHFRRLRSGRPETTLTSAQHLDLLRDIKLINSQIVAAAAYPVLNRAGELLASRVAGEETDEDENEGETVRAEPSPPRR
ncbi:Na/Pi cotransporter family protein [Tistrella mobilis]